MFQLSRQILLTILILTAVKSASANYWPAFRGAYGQGHADSSVSVPLSWSATDNIRWKVPIEGKAWSSPVVSGDVAFVTTAIVSADDLSLKALAIDISNGKPLWETGVFVTKVPRIHKKNSHASPTPLIEGDRLYVHFGPNGTACLEAKTGEIIWKQAGFPYPPVHGSASSIVLSGDNLIYSADGKDNPSIIALNKADGSLAWKKNREIDIRRKFSFSTPLLIDVNGNQQIISPCSGGVISYDPATGDEIWRCRYGEGYSVTPSPIFAHGLVYVSSGFDRAIAYAIRPDGEGDVTDTHLVWQYSKTVPRESSFIVVGNEFYMNDDKGVLTCLDAMTGELHYAERLNPEGGYSASPVYASGHLFFTNGEGVTTVVKPGKTFKKVGENRLGEYGLSSFAVLNDGFLHRTENHLIRIGK